MYAGIALCACIACSVLDAGSKCSVQAVHALHCVLALHAACCVHVVQTLTETLTQT